MTTIINKLSPALLALLALLTLFLFASCDKEEYSNEGTRDNSEKIHFEIAVGTATATPSGMETLVVTSPTYESTFENDDAIGVYIVKGSGGLQSSGNWVDNMKMTYNNGTWGYTLPSGKEYYPQDGDKLNFYAYYPYTSSLADATNFTFSVQSDQRDGANLSKSDLLIASKINVVKSNNPVLLNFSHALAMVELKVTEGGIGAQMSNKVIPTLEGCINGVGLNLSTGTVTTTGSATAVIMSRVEQSTDANYLTSYTYRAFVPAQTVTANTELFLFSQTAGTITRTLSHKPLEQVVLAEGEMKPYNITLQGASGTPAYAKGDYYPHKGFPILGVVFEISNGGVNGKIVSLDETRVKWGKLYEDTHARNHDNGIVNMKVIKGLNKFPQYPAFAWVHAKNKETEDYSNTSAKGLWCLPAMTELDTLYIFYNTNKKTINDKLTACGGTVFSSYWYWSSSELNQFNAVRESFGGDGTNGYGKQHDNNVRAISAF